MSIYRGALLALPILLPILTVFSIALGEGPSAFLYSSLPTALSTSLMLMLASSLLACLIGVTCAIMVTLWAIPARVAFDLLLILPLAMPGYVASFAYTEFFDSYPHLLAWVFPNSSLQHVSFRSFGGAVWIFAITLYPYVYLFTRAALLTRVGALIDVSRLFAINPLLRLALVFPLLRSSILAGSALVMMEVLTDYGLAEYFTLHTLSKSMFDIWFSLHDSTTAARIASCMLILAFTLLWVERWSRAQTKTQKHVQVQAKTLSSGAQFAFVLCLLVPFLLGFAFPVGHLCIIGAKNLTAERLLELGHASIQTFVLASVIALITLCWSGGLHLVLQKTQPRVRQFFGALASCGYAIPGMVMALGVLSLLTSFDRWLLANTSFFHSPIFTGSLAVLILAAVARFFAIGFVGFESGSEAIPQNLRYVKLLLPQQNLLHTIRLFWPLQQPALVTAFILIIVDYIKELPMTLILRPFGVNTLAVKAFSQAQNEQVANAAPEAVAMALLSATFLIFLCLRPGYRDPFGALPVTNDSGTSTKQSRTQTS